MDRGTDYWSRYLSMQGWVILNSEDQPILRTLSDDTGEEVAAVIKDHNEHLPDAWVLARARAIAMELVQVESFDDNRSHVESLIFLLVAS